MTYGGLSENGGPFYDNGSSCDGGELGSYDYGFGDASGHPLVPVGYPFVFNEITPPANYAMIYRVDLNSAFIDGLQTDSIEALTVNLQVVGSGGAWQLLTNGVVGASGSDLSGSSITSINEIDIKDALDAGITNYLYLTVREELVSGFGNGGASTDCTYLKAILNFSVRYQEITYPILSGGGGQLIHGGG